MNATNTAALLGFIFIVSLVVIGYMMYKAPIIPFVPADSDGADEPSSDFKQIRLETEDGSFVDTQLIPAALNPPVVIWGSRVFTLAPDHRSHEWHGMQVYNETFAWYSPNPLRPFAS